MVYRIELDPAESLDPLDPSISWLAFSMEVNFQAELRRDIFIQTDEESVGHILRKRLQRLQLNSINPKPWDEIIIEGADVEDPEMPYCSNGGEYLVYSSRVELMCHLANARLGEKQKLNLVFPTYLLNSLRTWELDMRQVFSCHAGRFNPLLAGDLRLDWELDPETSLRLHLEDIEKQEQGFPFHTVRNLAMILLLFGPKIDSMVKSKVAQEVTYETGETWRGPRPLPDVYGYHPGKPNTETPREMASYILRNCSTVESVCEAMEEFLSTLKPEFRQSFSVDFSGLLKNQLRPDQFEQQAREPTPESAQEQYAAQARADRGPSIEFKHHPATLDATHVVHWIRFVSALIEFAGHIGLESLILFLGLSENGYAYLYPPSSPDEKDGEETDGTDTEVEWEDIDIDEEFNQADASDDEWELRKWDTINCHPTLSPNSRKDPPDYSAEAEFQHYYPIAGLFTAMDMVGIDLDPDTAVFWTDALEVKYQPNMESYSEPELPEMVKEEEDKDDIEGQEAVEGRSIMEETRSRYSTEMDWIPESSSNSQLDDEDLGRKRRKYDL